MGLDICGEGDEAAVFAQNRAHRYDQGFNLQIHCGMVRSFQDDFKGDGVDAGRSGENALVLFVDDPVARGEAVDDGVDVSGQNFACFGEGWAKKVFSESVAANKSVNAVAWV